VKLPEQVTDNQAILLSDIFPTAYFGAKLAEISAGDTVAVYGCGPVGQFAIASAKLLGAGRVLAIDTIESRLDMARKQGAEVIDFNQEDPTEAVKRLTGQIGVDRAIDAVGVDAVTAKSGPAAKKARNQKNILLRKSRRSRLQLIRRGITGVLATRLPKFWLGQWTRWQKLGHYPLSVSTPKSSNRFQLGKQ
jgi:threonine dehydrogenase-like Zn-dependent dehydrogenase